MAPRSSLFSRSSRFPQVLVVLVVVGLFARLALCADPAAVRNDGSEYLAVARSLRTTGQYATDLKYHFYGESPIRHEALGDRPPVYPVVAALLQKSLSPLHPVTAARVGNVLLAALGCVLIGLYLRSLYGETVALLAVGYTFLLPHSLYWTSQPMTESLTLVLSFGALLLWQHALTRAGSSLPALGCGILGGLAYLTRPTGAVLALVCGADALRHVLVSGEREHGSEWGRLASLAAGFLPLALLYHLLLWAYYGSPTYSTLGYTFAVGTYYEVTYYGWRRVFPSPGEFLRSRWQELPPLLIRQACGHLQALFLPLAGFWPMALAARVVPEQAPIAGIVRRGRGVALLYAVAMIVVHVVVWSAWGSSRYFLTCLPILAAWLLDLGLRAAGQSERWRLTFRGLMAASWFGLVLLLVPFYRQQLGPDRGLAGLAAVKDAAEQIRDAQVIASDRPSTLNLILERPTVMLPRLTDAGALAQYVREYRPDAMVLFLHEPERASALAMAEAWRSGGLPAGWVLTRETNDYLIARRGPRLPALPRSTGPDGPSSGRP